MSTEPLVGNSNSEDNKNSGGGAGIINNPGNTNGNNTIGGQGEKVQFDESVNIIHCCLSINSTTIYTYDNPNILHKANLNYVEIITQNLGEINEVQECRMDHINLNQSIKINKKSINLVIYYKKNIMENNDLITIVILCSDKLMSSFVHNLLEKLMNEYVNEYYKINKRFEFKLRIKEIINQEEGHLIRLVENYGSVEGEIAQVRELMNENIDKILQRGENLDTLISKTSNLNTSSSSFRRRTTSVKRKMIWSNVKFVVIVAFIVLLVGYILLGLECGLPFYSRCIHPKKPNQPSFSRLQSDIDI